MTYRKFPSRYGLNYPRTPGWLGWTIGIRFALAVLLIWVLVR